MKDGALISNSGHFNVEIDLEDLAAMGSGGAAGGDQRVGSWCA